MKLTKSEQARLEAFADACGITLPEALVYRDDFRSVGMALPSL